MNIVTIWLVILLIVGAFFLFRHKNGKKLIDSLMSFFAEFSKPTVDANMADVKSDANLHEVNPVPQYSYVTISDHNAVASRVYSMEREIAKLKSFCENQKSQILSLEGHIKQMTNYMSLFHDEVEKMKSVVNPGNETLSSSVHPSLSFPYIAYASHMDNVTPKGFSNESLTSAENGCLFRINVESPTRASFTLTDDINVQQELLLTFRSGVLNDSCAYDDYPTESSVGIKTVGSGRLEYENGVWIVREKIKIKFS